MPPQPGAGHERREPSAVPGTTCPETTSFRLVARRDCCAIVLSVSSKRGFSLCLCAVTGLVAACSLDTEGTADPTGGAGGSGTGGTSLGGQGGNNWPDGSLGGAGGAVGGQGGAVGGQGGSGGADASVGGSGGSDAGPGGTGGTGGAPVWKPSDIPNCVLWLDAEDSATHTLSGNAMISWADKCGSSTATSTTPQAPTVGLVNGKQAVQCDGVDDRLNLTGPEVIADAYTLFFVVGNVPTTNVLPIWSNRDSTPPTDGTVMYAGYQGVAHVYQNSASAPQKLAGTTSYLNHVGPMVFEFVATPTGARDLLVDGVLQDTTASAQRVKTRLRAGSMCYDATPVKHAPLHLHETVVYDRALSAAERLEVRSKLQTKWGI